MRRSAALLALTLWSGAALASCPPAGHDAGARGALKAAGFAIETASTRNALALALLDCLADPDPQLRDGIAYEALSTWMRESKLDAATLQSLRARLTAMLQAPDPRGFAPPFAALVLSELARTDRIAAWMSDAQRDALVTDAAGYLSGVRDYRGFIDGQGWRHGVAHGADLVLQLALNPKLDRAQLARLREAVAVQVAPAANPSYVHGESMRLARAAYYIAQRGLHDTADWDAWFARLATPAPLPGWDAAFLSEAGLARRHDTVAFMTALYVLVQEHGDEALRARLLPGLRATLKAVP
ncbi:DUF2785 domain-containing protein [Agrilutibacter solisilvae]|uniref:DUF2785 domain-containing protein n=1 Tax=Agrilutibacter solisilvae TaxID=2763317 RepID=A0A975ARI2_9GAMM|nr:DUF2785 domain-containing protein [Lysobacter solisilvae]QSX76990.1 DUF2785 domain-containing protein [Lysobacter solisilvae]